MIDLITENGIEIEVAVLEDGTVDISHMHIVDWDKFDDWLSEEEERHNG